MKREKLLSQMKIFISDWNSTSSHLSSHDLNWSYCRRCWQLFDFHSENGSFSFPYITFFYTSTKYQCQFNEYDFVRQGRGPSSRRDFWPNHSFNIQNTFSSTQLACSVVRCLHFSRPYHLFLSTNFLLSVSNHRTPIRLEVIADEQIHKIEWSKKATKLMVFVNGLNSI